MMVTVRDGLGRPLYSLGEGKIKGTEQRYHPDTGQEMPDDFEMKYPGSDSGGSALWFFIVAFSFVVAVGFYFLK